MHFASVDFRLGLSLMQRKTSHIVWTNGVRWEKSNELMFICFLKTDHTLTIHKTVVGQNGQTKIWTLFSVFRKGRKSKLWVRKLQRNTGDPSLPVVGTDDILFAQNFVLILFFCAPFSEFFLLSWHWQIGNFKSAETGPISKAFLLDFWGKKNMIFVPHANWKGKENRKLWNDVSDNYSNHELRLQEFCCSQLWMLIYEWTLISDFVVLLHALFQKQDRHYFW